MAGGPRPDRIFDFLCGLQDASARAVENLENEFCFMKNILKKNFS
jgi:hypothetical protein